uniref:Calcineurin-like phosphoesterase domain-containing protein n=1 Tax=Bionectria ochroleuca TaxID=29856 RepID=A0A8H7K835_BIOOC
MFRHLLLASLFAGLSYQQSSNKFGNLKFSKNGTFHLNVLEDLHFGDSNIKDAHTLKVMETVLNAEPSDFVVINGDLLDRASTYRENRTAYIDELLHPLVARNLTWASTYGNHDHTVNTSAKLILETERKYPNSRTQQMVFGRESGVSNYYLPVYGSNCRGCNCTPELLIWFFDSRGGFYYKELKPDGSFVEQPSWVDGTVATWFQQTNARLVEKYKKVIPSIGFVHIPVNVAEAFGMKIGVDANRQPGINDTMPMAQQSYGFCADGRYNATCDYGGQDIPFLQTLASTPGLMAVFHAHEHGNTWCYKWDTLIPGMTIKGSGVNLCFGQHTGYGGAGDWIRGARQILITQSKLKNLELDTWIRLESGGVVGSVSLNSTYNKDFYPATPNQKTYI